MRGSTIVTYVLLAGALAAAAGCGRRGPLDTPYEAAVQARKDAQKAGVEPLPPEPEKPVEDKPFFLDRLIQ
jgi:predicted small lipoprotein YifL